jgi:predicted MFS family arabinose efflux permease
VWYCSQLQFSTDGQNLSPEFFGGVISSISFAIITDLFAINVRGRVMGFVQMAFASSQVLGIPIGLYLAKAFSWHAPFLMIVGFGIIVGGLIVSLYETDQCAFENPVERQCIPAFGQNARTSGIPAGFAATTLLATGGFMLMPFGTAYGVNNLGIKETVACRHYT